MKCPACGHEWLDRTADETVRREPEVGGPALEPGADTGDHRRFVSIARFKYAAEAGFFESELAAQLDVPTRIVEQSCFDAMAGLWLTWFALCVPEEHAVEAQQALSELVAREEAKEAEAAAAVLEDDAETVDRPASEDEFDQPTGTAAWTGGPAWEPVDLTEVAAATRGGSGGSPAWWALFAALLAGAVGFGVARLVAARADQGRVTLDAPAAERLWRELSRRPWLQPVDGRGVRVLWADPKTRTVLIREDLDGDGQVDRELELLKL